MSRDWLDKFRYCDLPGERLVTNIQFDVNPISLLKLIANDGKADRMMLSGTYLNARVRGVELWRGKKCKMDRRK
jgi:hypothetical protein